MFQKLQFLNKNFILIYTVGSLASKHSKKTFVKWLLTIIIVFRYTPLDYALLGEHQELTQFLLEHGALSITAIQDIAASSIQALYKGYKVRRAFRERKKLLMRHEQLRKDAAK